MSSKLSKKTNPKNTLLINLVLLVVFIVFAIYFLLFPTIENIKQLRISIANTKIENNRAIEKGKNTNNQADKLKIISNQTEKLDTIFVKRNRELEFITHIEGVASKNNVEQNFKLQNVPKYGQDTFITIPITINITGSFANVMNYLLDIETMSYHLNINNIQMKKSNNQVKINVDAGQAEQIKNQSIIIMDITADTYFK